MCYNILVRHIPTCVALLAALALGCATPNGHESDAFRRAEVAELQGRLPAAAEWWQVALADSGGQSTRAARGLARVLSLGGDEDGALRILKSALPPGGVGEVEDRWFLEDLSKHYARVGAHDKALEALQVVAQRDPIRPSVAIYLGQLLLKLEKPEAALDPLRRAARARPDHQPVRLALARALVATQQPSAALEEYQAGKALGPLAPEHLLVAASQVHLLPTGDVQAAWAETVTSWFDEPTRLDYLQPRLMLAVGNLFLIRGDEPQACSILERAAEMDPGDVSILTALGRALLQNGQLEGAREILAHAQQLELDELESADLAQLQVQIESTAAITEPDKQGAWDDK